MSDQQTTCANDVYDFYVSEKQLEEIKWTRNSDPFTTKSTKFKGKEYSECCKSGKKPGGNFDDYIFLGTGTLKDCTFV